MEQTTGALEDDSKQMDEAMQQKKEIIAARLQKRDEDRVEKIQKRLDDDAERVVKQETSDFFTTHFREESRSINVKLECSGLEEADKMEIAEHFRDLAESYEKILKFVNDSTVFLRPFQLEQAQKTLNQIQNDITSKKQLFIPKKKFAFKSKKKKNVFPTKDEKPDEKESSKKIFSFKNECGLSDRCDETLLLTDNEINQRDVSLVKIKDCKISLKGYPATLHLCDIESSVICCGPVSGSVFVDRCQNSTIATGCQQLRVHNTAETDFYLHVTSRAIIEDSRNVRFAPYNWSYECLDSDFEKSGLDRRTNNWNQVDDFNWLANDAASPNWAILPEDARKLNF